jgi:hypothetical protein
MTSDDADQVGQRVIRILIDSTDPSDPSKYTFTDDSNDPANTVGEDGNISLGTADSAVPTTCSFILSANVLSYAAWNTDTPVKNVTIAAGDDCPPAGSSTSLPPGWKVMVSSDARVLSVYDPNIAGSEFSYRLNLRGRHGNHRHDVTLDPLIKNVPS